MKLSNSILLLVSVITSSALAIIPHKDLKPNLFILTDIGNEPDDSESLVRLLLYSNELNIKGIVAVTSFWLNYTTRSDLFDPIFDAYEEVQPTLLKHSDLYPPADYIRSISSYGKSVYGLSALGGELSPGAELLISALDNTPTGETLHIAIWGGANVLAEALRNISAERSQNEIDIAVNKISALGISDQDNAGSWIRYNYPRLKYIVSIHGWNQYSNAGWVGFSASIDFGGPNNTVVSADWLTENIRSVGPLGASYPQLAYVMEGDTPSFLGVIPNGLNEPTKPEYGGWGGRYSPSDLSLNYNHYGDAADTVVGLDNASYTGNKASIWRWREDYQKAFANRIQWTINDFEDVGHEPVVVANGTISVTPFYVKTFVNSTVVLDISESYDLNDLELTYEWIQYKEPTTALAAYDYIETIDIVSLNDESSIVKVTVPDFDQSWYRLNQTHYYTNKPYHFIAKVSNDATVSYRRFIIDTFLV